MPIISRIGRRSARVRLLVAAIYLALGLGAVTMVYPFLLMIAGTTKSGVDTPEAKLVPDFLVDDLALYRKDAEGFFNENLGLMQAALDQPWPSFRLLVPPTPPNRAMAEAWHGFIRGRELPHHYFELGYIHCPVSRGTAPGRLRAFKKAMFDRFAGDLEALNRDLGVKFIGWNHFHVLPADYTTRTVTPGATAFHREYQAFKEQAPIHARYYFSIDGFFRNTYLMTQYTKDIDSYNRSHGTAYTSWQQVHLPPRYPSGQDHTDAQREDWEAFVRSILSLLWIRADAMASAPYQDFLLAKYRDIAVLNRHYGTAYDGFGAVALPAGLPEDNLIAADWASFLQGWRDPETGDMHRAPVESLRIHSIDNLFRDHLREAHGSLAQVNAALGTAYADWLDILPPQQDFLHEHWFSPRQARLRLEFCVRNFITVLDYVLLHGRAVFNTVVFVALTILCSLAVNPLAAYALSRYRPPSSYKILLFLMLTMAFPPMVTQIPAFLMLREFGLLNTFAALILPGMASGYSIFLLKGFFDSLPQELYESAAIDGAGEIRIFLQITMSLSKPILAVIALGAFNGAYGNFMMALLICQDQKMWTLMPWLYQLQMRSSQGLVFASLVIAAIPTFLIFSLCQNVIMRGIVVPVEK